MFYFHFHKTLSHVFALHKSYLESRFSNAGSSQVNTAQHQARVAVAATHPVGLTLHSPGGITKAKGTV